MIYIVNTALGGVNNHTTPGRRISAQTIISSPSESDDMTMRFDDMELLTKLKHQIKSDTVKDFEGV